MDKNLEELEPQTIQEEETPEVEEEVTLSKAELDELRHKAEVSSQNYARMKKLEAENANLKSLEVPLSDIDDEKYAELKTEISSMKNKLDKNEVVEAYPAIKQVWSEFETYLSDPENAGLSMKTAARVFLAEKGALEPKRRGLEKATGGPKVPLSSGMTSEEVKRLRETDYKKYTNMLKKGQLKFS